MAANVTSISRLNARKSLGKRYNQDVHMSTLNARGQGTGGPQGISDPTSTELSNMFPAQPHYPVSTLYSEFRDRAGWH